VRYTVMGLPGSEGGGLEQSEDVEREQPEAGADRQDTVEGLPGSEGGGLEQSEDIEREQPEAGADRKDTRLRDTLQHLPSTKKN
jgi:hypothetical protein